MYNKILDIGVPPNSELSREMRYIRLTNIVNLFLIFLISIPAILFIKLFTEGGIQSYIRFFILIFFSLVNIILNGFHRHLTSKVLTALIPFFCVFVFPLVNGFVHQGMFLWFPYGIMIVGANSFLIFSFENKCEKMTMHVLLIFYMIAAIWYDQILIYFAEGLVDVSFIINNYMYYQVSKIFLVTSLYVPLYIFKKEYNRSQSEIIALNKILDEKNAALQSLNFALEIKVSERTEKLKLQNQRIKGFAYLNSHGIRAIVARILGLTALMKLDISSEEQEFYQKEIISNSNELDKLTEKLSEELVEVN